MKKFLEAEWISWIHLVSPTHKEIDQIVKKYDFHEIIEEDLREENNHDIIDLYDDHIFIVLHFPKYNEKKWKYFLNEFNIILWKNFIISVTKYETNHIVKIRDEYKDDLKEKEKDEKYKISPYYILYRIIDQMYDKILIWLNKFTKDLVKIEDSIFDSKKLQKDSLEMLLIKKRNIVILKNMISSHQEILEELWKATNKLYQWDLDVYFEDLQYKVDKITWQIRILEDNTDWLSTTYNTLANIKTNSTVSILTIFTAIIWVMTLITGFYGMNVKLPWWWHENMYFYIAWWMVCFSLLSIFMIIFSKKKGRL